MRESIVIDFKRRDFRLSVVNDFESSDLGECSERAVEPALIYTYFETHTFR